MEQEFLIFEYLDGEMNPAQEEAFFNLLSQNEELRLEFKQQIALKNAFVKDMKGFAPNPESTMNIFAKLGISATALTAASNTIGSSSSTSFFGTISNFFTGTAAKSIISTLLVSLATFATLLKLEVIEWYDLEAGNKIVSTKKVITPNNNQLTNELESQTNLQNSELDNYQQNITPKTIEKIVYKNNFIFTIDTLKLKGAEKERAIALLNKLENYQNNILLASNYNLTSKEISELKDIDYSIILENKSKFNYNPSLNSIPNQKVFIGTFSQFSNDWNIPISLEGNIQLFNNGLQKEIDVNRAYSQINNLRLSAIWNINSEFSIGSNFTNESYYQNFNYIDKSGRTFEYFQKPEFNVLSAMLRYSPEYLRVNNNIIDIKPLTQASYGFDINGGGNVSKIGLGANIYVSEQLYFQLLSEYSNLTYLQDNQKYNSNKMVFTFGVGWNLGK